MLIESSIDVPNLSEIERKEERCELDFIFSVMLVRLFEQYFKFCYLQIDSSFAINFSVCLISNSIYWIFPFCGALLSFLGIY